ncbi:LexA family transcriptional regulator [Vibrio sp. LaRot3]|uniref:LexA family transcriptional regulator n=1 Tax=Vibrio sp. LaRot3 TaxID=2998829 RepID=UPI0022CDD50E|nr:helix-turn-helix transcriptional regulator [Vibrio sp. LaRot3]MDA0148820.1 helix-turn-helix transcriptional regulator [Vibrio sp. LaRot3]
METNKTLGSSDDKHQSTIQDRLKTLMGNETESSFALKCKIPLSTMRKYLNGSTPGLDKALQIARINDVSLDWLASGEGLVAPETKKADDVESEFALIPGYSVQVSAGHGCLTKSDTKPTRYLAFRRKWLKWKRFEEKDLSVVWAKGDSMHPTISDNDTLVVHLGRKDPKDGYIYVFRNGDELFVKRFQDMMGSWRLISDNALYAAMDIPKEDQHQFEVIGQVVHLAKDIAD